MEPITREEAIAILEAAPVAHIGLIHQDRPYVTPMSFVVDKGRILFRTMPGRKLDALRENSSVCIEVSRFDESTGDWVSVIVRGEASESNSEEDSELVVRSLLSKYRPSTGPHLSRGGIQPMIGLPHVIVVEIEEISGMCSGRGLGHRTKPGRL